MGRQSASASAVPTESLAALYFRDLRESLQDLQGNDSAANETGPCHPPPPFSAASPLFFRGLGVSRTHSRGCCSRRAALSQPRAVDERGEAPAVTGAE